MKIKRERHDSSERDLLTDHKTIKAEISTEPIEHKVNIKREIKVEKNNDIETFFDNFANLPKNEPQEPETPVKTHVKSEMFWDESNPSPFNKEMFKNFSLQSPIVSEDSQSNPSKSETRKSVRRTVFKRESPYKRYFEDDSGSSSKLRVSAKDRLGTKISDTNFQ